MGRNATGVAGRDTIRLVRTPLAPRSALLPMMVIHGALATLVAVLEAFVLGLVLAPPGHNGEGFVLTIFFGVVLTPGAWLVSALLCTGSWLVHGAVERAPLAVDAALGGLLGAAWGGGYIAQDVLGMRPASLDAAFERDTLVMVALGGALGVLLGLAAGGLARWRMARDRDAVSRPPVAIATNLLYLLMAAPGLALLFTLAHYAGRPIGWEIVTTPFVYLIALVIVGVLMVAHLVVVAIAVAIHRGPLSGRGTIVLEGAVGLAVGASMLAIGTGLLDDGVSDFTDPASLFVACAASLAIAAVIPVSLGAGWGRAPIAS